MKKINNRLKVIIALSAVLSTVLALVSATIMRIEISSIFEGVIAFPPLVSVALQRLNIWAITKIIFCSFILVSIFFSTIIGYLKHERKFRILSALLVICLMVFEIVHIGLISVNYDIVPKFTALLIISIFAIAFCIVALTFASLQIFKYKSKTQGEF